MAIQSITLDLPNGFSIAGNYGDGKWRVIHQNNPQMYLGKPQDFYEQAVAEAWRLSRQPHIDVMTAPRRMGVMYA